MSQKLPVTYWITLKNMKDDLGAAEQTLKAHGLKVGTNLEDRISLTEDESLSVSDDVKRSISLQGIVATLEKLQFVTGVETSYNKFLVR